MGAARWPLIEELFHRAVDLGPAERATFLDEVCAGDGDLRRDVESLLAHDASTDYTMQAAVGRAVEQLPPANAVPAMEGRQLRGYELIREIGRGGMGSVYLAERADGMYRRRVAVKFVHAEENRGEILERFHREREILASLDHPNIARLIDGGSTEEGLPYFVMEFVDGQPIHRWCDERKLNIRHRLEVFRSVCAAVQYAHQRLVVHRDLKPGNILVTADGTVKLLDFGIAKLLNVAHTGDLAATVTMMRLMTPDYASPEQAKGEAITTLTDVYSLGVVLYELLTGHRPYHLRSAAMHEIARIISEEEPPRPSDVVATTEEGRESERGRLPITPEAVSEVREGDLNRLRKRLQGDVDSILLTTLRKEPTRRYSSVEALSEDLQRHLENRPISAREDSFWYRASRFARRHPGGVTAGVAIALSLGAALITTLWGIRVALEASQRSLPGRTILAPQMALWLSLASALLAGAVYLTRAMPLRVVGALAGGAIASAAGLIKFRLDYSMGWWRSLFAEDPDPLSLFSQPAMFLIVMFAGAIALLASWRISRRFGWVGPVAVVAVVSAGAPFRERLYYDKFMHVMTVSWGFFPMVADAALWSVAFVLGLAVMRLIAGPARNDRLARKP